VAPACDLWTVDLHLALAAQIPPQRDAGSGMAAALAPAAWQSPQSPHADVLWLDWKILRVPDCSQLTKRRT